jgi:hypothetical protein
MPYGQEAELEAGSERAGSSKLRIEERQSIAFLAL